MPGTGQFTIQITNKSGDLQNFYLFLEKPELPGIKEEKIFTNVYGVAPDIEVDATAIFEMNHNYYAIYGTTTHKPDPGQTISTIAPKAVSLGASKTDKDASCWGVTASDHLHPKWTNETKIIAPNGFGISTDNSWHAGVSTNIFVGIGSDDPTGGSNKVLITTVVGDPSIDYIFTIKTVYYIAVGNLQQGELVDVSEAGKFFKIDATDDPDPLKKYRFLKNGTFEPDT